jgi:hypothetical protein
MRRWKLILHHWETPYASPKIQGVSSNFFAFKNNKLNGTLHYDPQLNQQLQEKKRREKDVNTLV